MKKFKYLFVYFLPISVLIAFNTQGMFTFFPVILFFGIVPLIELIIKPDRTNFNDETAIRENNNPFYDWIMFLAVPIQLAVLIYFLFTINKTPIGSVEYVGRIVSMGIM